MGRGGISTEAGFQYFAPFQLHLMVINTYHWPFGLKSARACAYPSVTLRPIKERARGGWKQAPRLWSGSGGTDCSFLIDSSRLEEPGSGVGSSSLSQQTPPVCCRNTMDLHPPRQLCTGSASLIACPSRQNPACLIHRACPSQ